MKKITVFVTGYENAGGVSGWDWFYEKENADNQFRAIEQAIKDFNVKHTVNKAISYRGELQVDVTGLTLRTDEANDNIQRQVESFLEENEFENAFN
jgi:hypothetical protein